MNLPPVLTLREALDYGPETGLFVWKERPIHHFSNDHKWSAAQCQKRWNTNHAGRPALTTLEGTGYFGGVLDSVRITAHRAAWAITAGVWPIHTIDHINGDRADNRLCNLREATKTEQSRNTSAHHNSTSKYLGVSFRAERGVWRACIRGDGKQRFLGSFTDEIEAAKAYDKAAQRYFGDFARLNFPKEAILPTSQ